MDLWDNNKRSSIFIIRVPEGEEKRVRLKEYLKKRMAQNFLNWVKDTNLQIQEVEQTLNRINLKKSRSSYIIFKLCGTKDDEVLKAVRAKQCITCKRTSFQIISYILSEIIKTRMK